MKTSFTKLTYWAAGECRKWIRSDDRNTRNILDTRLGWNGLLESERPTAIGPTVEIDLPLLMWGSPDESRKDIQEMCDAALAAITV